MLLLLECKCYRIKIKIPRKTTPWRKDNFCITEETENQRQDQNLNSTPASSMTFREGPPCLYSFVSYSIESMEVGLFIHATSLVRSISENPSFSSSHADRHFINQNHPVYKYIRVSHSSTGTSTDFRWGCLYLI